MNALADAGIYVISDLSNPSESIDRSDPQWNTALYARYTAVVDEMAKYNNTMGFFAGNEVSNTVNTTAASAFVKAAVRDMKSYIQQKDYRAIGVGYATNDDSSIRVNMADYFNCDNTADGIDFWGYNIYSWCGDSSYQSSGYQERTQEFKDYSVPVFFAEYGCNAVQPRKFTEVDALYGDPMAQVWSGGIVYMYFQEANNYGNPFFFSCFPSLIHTCTDAYRPRVGRRQLQRQQARRLHLLLCTHRQRNALGHKQRLVHPHQHSPTIVPIRWNSLGSNRNASPANPQHGPVQLHECRRQMRRQRLHRHIQLLRPVRRRLRLHRLQRRDGQRHHGLLRCLQHV